ncbi:hypothetical protein BDC45DRAFT_568888 [Circinella umbellata]|nr:hypothetical protein BDC45DRAFT_568888 [Circinella umbellata]
MDSTRVTHAGALEAESLGVPLDVIKKGGDWKDRLGRLETHYLGKLPSQFARGMAGFWDKPFRLPRNNVSPSLKLQKMVFPWIEDCYGPDNDPWKKFCEHEMYERNENDDGSDDGDCENVEFVERDGIQHQHSKNERSKAPSSLQRGADTAKRGFLRLLVRNSFDQQQQSSSRLESVILVQSLMAASDGSDFAPASSSSFFPSSNAIINPPVSRDLSPAQASPSPQVRISSSPRPRTFINNNTTSHSPLL